MKAATFALVSTTVLVAASCVGRPFAGLDAQRALPAASSSLSPLPVGTIVFVNGVRLAPGQTLDGLRPATIASIDVVKGVAARLRYGDEAEAGAILISTTDSAFARRVTIQPPSN